eukprot:ctg_321.g98
MEARGRPSRGAGGAAVPPAKPRRLPRLQPARGAHHRVGHQAQGHGPVRSVPNRSDGATAAKAVRRWHHPIQGRPGAVRQGERIRVLPPATAGGAGAPQVCRTGQGCHRVCGRRAYSHRPGGGAGPGDVGHTRHGGLHHVVGGVQDKEASVETRASILRRLLVVRGPRAGPGWHRARDASIRVVRRRNCKSKNDTESLGNMLSALEFKRLREARARLPPDSQGRAAAPPTNTEASSLPAQRLDDAWQADTVEVSVLESVGEDAAGEASFLLDDSLSQIDNAFLQPARAASTPAPNEGPRDVPDTLADVSNELSLKCRVRVTLPFATLAEAHEVLREVRGHAGTLATPSAAEHLASVASRITAGTFYYYHPAMSLPREVASMWDEVTRPLSAPECGAPFYGIVEQVDALCRHARRMRGGAQTASHRRPRVALRPAAVATARAVEHHPARRERQVYIMRRVRDWQRAFMSLYERYYRGGGEQSTSGPCGASTFYVLGERYAAVFTWCEDDTVRRSPGRRSSRQDTGDRAAGDGRRRQPLTLLSHSTESTRQLLQTEYGAEWECPFAGRRGRRRPSVELIGDATVSALSKAADGTVDSLLVFRGGKNVQRFYEFLLSHGARLAQARDVPTLVSAPSMPFANSCSKTLPIMAVRTMTWEASTNADAPQESTAAKTSLTLLVCELAGPVLPAMQKCLAEAAELAKQRCLDGLGEAALQAPASLTAEGDWRTERFSYRILGHGGM